MEKVVMIIPSLESDAAFLDSAAGGTIYRTAEGNEKTITGYFHQKQQQLLIRQLLLLFLDFDAFNRMRTASFYFL